MKGREITIQLSVTVSDGSFESRLVIPVASTPTQRKAVTEMWLEQIGLAMKQHATQEEKETT